MRRYLPLLVLVGCAGQPYWVHTHSPLPVKAVVEVVDLGLYCQAHGPLYGCAVRNDWYGTIYIQKGLNSDLRACVESHERRHVERGDSHELRFVNFAVDCGDGTMWLNSGVKWF